MCLHVFTCLCGGSDPQRWLSKERGAIKDWFKKASVVWHGSKAAINQPGPEDTHTWKVLVDTRSVSHTH